MARKPKAKKANPFAENIVPMADFLKKKIPPADYVLSPWLRKGGSAEIYGPRGCGKTHVMLGVITAIATGSSFLGWEATKPRRVLHIDGEMPIDQLQARLADTTRRMGVARSRFLASNLGLLADGLEQDKLPPLDDPAALRDYYLPRMMDFDVISLDNLLSLTNTGDRWSNVLRDFVLFLRRQKKALIFAHHAGKNKNQLGSARKETNLDTVIALRWPKTYQAKDGARFVIDYEKARGFHGAEAEAFEVQLKNDKWHILETDSTAFKKWLDTKIVFGKFEETTGRLRQSWQNFADAAGVEAGSNNAFAMRLLMAGFRGPKTTTRGPNRERVRIWQGGKLK